MLTLEPENIANYGKAEITTGRDKTQTIQNRDQEAVLADLGCEERMEFNTVKKFGVVT